MRDMADVLFVTDVEGTLESLVGTTPNGKYGVFVANSGSEAVDMLQKKRFDFIYLVVVPKINGRDAYEEIKHYNPETMVLEIESDDLPIIYESFYLYAK